MKRDRQPSGMELGGVEVTLQPHDPEQKVGE